MTLDTLSPAARMWGAPGEPYDGISFGLSDTIAHTVQALWPRPGERVLDIGTGTGWAARLAAWRGAEVTGVDIAPGMLQAAERLSARLDPRPVFRPAAAEALPFPDAQFDGVISTYGVIFSDAPSTAVAEMARVLRPGGRLALATWADRAGGYIADFFALLGAWSDAPPPSTPASPSPFDWGREDWLRQVVGARFEIEIREQVTTLYAPDVPTVWQEYLNGFGPVAATHAALPPERREAFRAAFAELHRPFATGLGLVIPRTALVVRGVRR
ncbi:class I SAM-dependent methyltransferase [Albidovulum sediminicola]|uniref:Methyltransferase domain-containing protein n=1 Tax=Albidovulum sediminicola TaxID=2984331 RepID=A0ABT2Z5S3_9RHOB|nr:methyltransferase domain-containing protein [Defluviimonas sp. WL0075]MCV2866420.1 methyltransferase domain-containing protein [Defluviimonas sp. WL0075]